MKKNSKKNDLDFCQNSMTRDMNWKLGKTGVAGDVEILAENWMYTSSIIC